MAIVHGNLDTSSDLPTLEKNKHHKTLNLGSTPPGACSFDMVSVDTMSCNALSSFWCPSGSPCSARLLIVFVITAARCCIVPLLVLVIDCMTAAMTWHRSWVLLKNMTCCKNWSTVCILPTQPTGRYRLNLVGAGK